MQFLTRNENCFMFLSLCSNLIRVEKRLLFTFSAIYLSHLPARNIGEEKEKKMMIECLPTIQFHADQKQEMSTVGSQLHYWKAGKKRLRYRRKAEIEKYGYTVR